MVTAVQTTLMLQTQAVAQECKHALSRGVIAVFQEKPVLQNTRHTHQVTVRQHAAVVLALAEQKYAQIMKHPPDTWSVLEYALMDLEQLIAVLAVMIAQQMADALQVLIGTLVRGLILVQELIVALVEEQHTRYALMDWMTTQTD